MLIVSAKKVMFSSVFVCLFVSMIAVKNKDSTDFHKIL